MKTKIERTNEIAAQLKAAYDQDIAEGHPDMWGVVYDAPRHDALIEALEQSGEWAEYTANRPDVFRTA